MQQLSTNDARSRLTRKLVALFLVPTVLCIVALSVETTLMWQKSLLYDAERDVGEHVAMLRAMLVEYDTVAEKEPLARVVNELAEGERIHAIALYDRAGVLVARSPMRPSEAVRTDAIGRMALEHGSYHRIEEGEDGATLVWADRVAPPSQVGVVVLSHTLVPIERHIRRGVLRIAVLGGALVIVLAILAVLLARALGQALGDLVFAAERVASGRLDVRIPEASFFELGRIGRAFNDMTHALGEAQERIESVEADRRTMQRRIEHAQALAIVGQVTASFAHEIGSPLNTILGWARMGGSTDELSTEARKQFDTIATQSERITRIVQRMLSVARPSSGSRTDVDLGEVAREVSAFLAADARARKIALRTEIAEKVPRIFAYRDQLLQLVINLCVNAVQAQPDGGKVTILVYEESSSGPRSNSLVLEVRDAGPGIPEAERSQIFEAFYTTKRTEGGTGLGLPIVAGIVRELGGCVEVGDAVEGGASFRVVLPVISIDDVPPSGRPADGAASAGEANGEGS